MTDEVFFDPNQLETVRRRSECLDFMRDTMKRGGGIHEGDAQILTQLVSNLYSVLPVENAEQVAVGDSMREDREAYLRRIRALGDLRESSPDEYAREVWRENEIFIRRCTRFMNDTLFVRTVRKKKEPTVGAAYEPK